MKSILTKNKLGHATLMPTHRSPDLYITSESGNGHLSLVGDELKQLVTEVINKKKFGVTTNSGEYRLEFNSPKVTVIFQESSEGKEEATFSEVKLVKLIDISMVRELVLSRMK